MSLRTTWRVNYKDNNLAENLIESKRRNLDEKLAKVEGVHFFFSSITGTRTNAKTSRKEKDKLDANQQRSSSDKKNDSMDDETEDLFSQFYPGIAYFVTFTPSPTCNSDRRFEFLHFGNTEAEINFIKTRVKHESEEQEHSERLSTEPFNVFKDHNNDAVRQFIKLSSQFCYAKELNEIIYDRSEEEKTAVFGIRHLVPDNMNCKFLYPCRRVIVNDSDSGEIL